MSRICILVLINSVLGQERTDGQRSFIATCLIRGKLTHPLPQFSHYTVGMSSSLFKAETSLLLLVKQEKRARQPVFASLHVWQGSSSHLSSVTVACPTSDAGRRHRPTVVFGHFLDCCCSCSGQHQLELRLKVTEHLTYKTISPEHTCDSWWTFSNRQPNTIRNLCQQDGRTKSNSARSLH